MIPGAAAASIGDLFGANERTLLAWLERGPVLALRRYLRAGGSRDWEVQRSRSELDAFVRRSPVGADVLVFHPGVLATFLPLRAYLARGAAIEGASKDDTLLVVAIDFRPQFEGQASWVELDQGEDLRGHEDLVERSRELLIGITPNYARADDDTLISAVVGNINGPR
ncbi:MAG: hypothetical protein JNK05_23570 [Myxococcales bacterium]|nr:hypothetical protein [Myxococcales bacterium]